MEKFKLETIAKTENPQSLVYKAMRSCHLPGRVTECDFSAYSESKCGELIVKHLLSGNRGHFGCFEHPSISFSCEAFPHSVMQQLRTHRVGCSFDVQSFRFCSSHLVACADMLREGRGAGLVENVIYIRPEGKYFNHETKSFFEYTSDQRKRDILRAADAVVYYAEALSEGYPPEQARSLLLFDYRQNWVMSVNMRSMMHILDLRHKPDAQLEIQKFSELLFGAFKVWAPEVADWYGSKRLGKAILAP